MTEFKFELGEEVEDIITGLKGYIIEDVSTLPGVTRTGFSAERRRPTEITRHRTGLDEPRIIKTGRKLKGMPERTTETRQANKQGAMGVPASSRSHP